ncbi:MAG: carbon storage regulator [Halioglobus sp.]|jgi:carbon storage regulator CsrA|nr:carbon storage regulator [Halioglobus sp.]
MLCLTRHVAETIHIGNIIVIVIQRIGDSQVRIGIHAPRELTIVRGEGHRDTAPVNAQGASCFEN